MKLKALTAGLLLTAATTATAMEEKNIVEIAAGAGTFNTLVAAVTAADLGGVLSSEGPFTVFAPTDEAFAALPEGTLEMLLKPENKDTLVSILTYHVLPGNFPSNAIIDDTGIDTVNGEPVMFDTDMGMKVDDANVVQADIMASNGMIHVIDKVIMPDG